MQMQAISVVIVCRNEANVIGATLRSLEGLTDDILVYDNGSTDATIDVAKSHNARVEQGSWEGFGKTKKKASSFAKYDWILSLDADEAISNTRLNTSGIVIASQVSRFLIFLKIMTSMLNVNKINPGHPNELPYISHSLLG